MIVDNVSFAAHTSVGSVQVPDGDSLNWKVCGAGSRCVLARRMEELPSSSMNASVRRKQFPWTFNASSNRLGDFDHDI
jgi:hypothetical protein